MLKAFSALGAIAVASVLLVPTASLASTLGDAEIVTASVSYADLNLSHAQGVNSLAYRIKGTAQSICGAGFRYELVNGVGRRACVIDAVASAQPAFEAAVDAARRGSVTISSGASLIITARK